MSIVTLTSTCMIKDGPRSMSTGLAELPSSFSSVNNISKQFSLKTSSFKISTVAVHKVKLIGPEGEETEFDAPNDSYILDSAKAAGLELPYSCRAGAGSPVLARRSQALSINLMDLSSTMTKWKKDIFSPACRILPRTVSFTHKEDDLY